MNDRIRLALERLRAQVHYLDTVWARYHDKEPSAVLYAARMDVCRTACELIKALDNEALPHVITSEYTSYLAPCPTPGPIVFPLDPTPEDPHS